MKFKEAVAILKSIGYSEFKGVRDSHYQYENPETGEKFSVPFHGGKSADIPNKVAVNVKKAARKAAEKKKK